MASRITIDPVQGLVDYVLEIKPYHTKIVEILVEHIQTEPIDVTIIEDLDMCINLGIPDIDTRFSYTIIGVDTIANTFTISGDKRLNLHVGQVMEVFRSTLNDNRYTITSLEFDGVNTEVGVSITIPSTTVDGTIVYRVIEYCPEGNLYSEYLAPVFEEEACGGGFGALFDSIPTTYEAQVGTGTGSPLISYTITASGDLSSAFVIGSQFYLEYVTTTEPGTVVEGIYTIANVSVAASVTTITTTQPIPAPTTIDIAIVYPLDTQYAIDSTNNGGTTNTFDILGDYTGVFITGSLIEVSHSFGNDGVFYVLQSTLVGGNTRIAVAQHVPNPLGEGQLKLKNIGFDEIVQCTNVPEGRIDVMFDERIEFNTQLHPLDDIYAYNLENTDSTLYGSGSPLLAIEPLTVNHEGTYGGGSPLANVVVSSVSPDKFEIYGGNFAYHFFGNTTFDGYTGVSLSGQWQITNFPVVAVGDGVNTMSVPGDHTSYFTPGVSFYVDYTLTNKGWFTVVSSTYVGSPGNTVITVSEEVVNATFNNGDGGSPTTVIEQNYSKNLGNIKGALFDASTQTTIVIPKTTGDASVDRITYIWSGPLHVDVDLLPTSLINPTISSVVDMSNEIVASANYLNIVDVDLSLDTFTVLGDQTTLFPDASKFTIQDAYSTGLSPETTNNGTWTVSRAFYNGAGNETVTAVDTGADTFTIAGNYADKFIPGFAFIVAGSGSPSNDGSYVVQGSGSPLVGATYSSGPNTTTIPVTTQIPSSLIGGLLTFGGTDETLIYISGNIITDQQPYGKILNITGVSAAQLSGTITDDLNFGWTVTDWFQYMILSVDLVENTITIADPSSTAVSDLQIGQDFEILGGFDTTGSPPSGSPAGITNNGMYKIRIDEDYRMYGSPVLYRTEVNDNGDNTVTLTVYPNITTAVQPYGWIEPNNDAQAIFAFTDAIGVSCVEAVDAAVIQTGGSIIDSFDYPFWDVGSFDETLGTVIHLYSNTFE